MLAEHLPELQKRYPVSHLALFGSVTRDDYHPKKSDIDIMVEFNGAIGWEFFDLEQELQQLLGKKVDLVSRKAIKPHYWDYIKKDIQHV